MLVKLLKNIEEGGQLKVNRHRLGPLNQAVQLAQSGAITGDAAQKLIDSARAQVVETAFVKGAVIDMSDASARKYIAAGLAEAYVAPAQPAE